MSKKQIIILISLVILAGVIFGVYYFYFRQKAVEPATPTPPSQTTQPTGTTAQPQTDNRLIQLSRAPAVSPTLGADEKTVKFVGKEGGIFEIGLDGQNLKEVKFTALQNLIKILWSPDKNGFIGIYESGGVRKMSFYDTVKQSATPFSQSVKQIAFSKKENKIAYHYFDGSLESSSIKVSDSNGKNEKTVFQTRLGEMRLDWADEAKISVSTIPTGVAENTLWVLDSNTQKLRAILANIYGLTVKWDNAGERFVFSQTNSRGNGLELWISNQNGTKTNKLDITTLPEKCAFAKDNQNIICAVPAEIPDIIWPDDYYKRVYSAREQIWKINLSDNKKEMLYEFLAGEFDAADLALSSDENYLVFLNKVDGNVYSLRLK